MEDQSKYYLSAIQKPPLLNMKLENRDINIVERANISKFSKLDDIEIPLSLLKVFFNDLLVGMIVGYTKVYSHREKADISFEITNEDVNLFQSMLLLSGCQKLPDYKIYGRLPPTLLCKQGMIQCLIICSSVFFEISIFVNNLIHKTNSRSSFP